MKGKLFAVGDLPRVTWYDGVRFEEVSVGYPREWRDRPPRRPLRQILPLPSPDDGSAAAQAPSSSRDAHPLGNAQ